jgi:hypothetical protein
MSNREPKERRSRNEEAGTCVSNYRTQTGGRPVKTDQEDPSCALCQWRGRVAACARVRNPFRTAVTGAFRRLCAVGAIWVAGRGALRRYTACQAGGKPSG